MTFASAASIACSRLITVRGESIVYRRGADASVDLVAIPADGEKTREPGEGISVEDNDQDFLIKASALALATAGAIEPEQGDQIEWDGREYVVASSSSSERAWKREGHRGFFVRVSTREV